MQLIPDSVKVAKTQLAKTHQIEAVAEAWGFHSPRSPRPTNDFAGTVGTVNGSTSAVQPSK
jgi:hypothetical protein